ncbi:MAG: hypothetical protein ABR529_15305 [Actinomycetota bacterium]
MHVLRQIHKALNPLGLLLDIHPQPEDPRVEIERADQTVPIGRIDSTEDNQEIREARKRLALIQCEGLFRLEGKRFFDLRVYHESVDAWFEYRREKGATSVVAPSVLRAARRELRSGEGQVVVIERVRASALRRCE